MSKRKSSNDESELKTNKKIKVIDLKELIGLNQEINEKLKILKEDSLIDLDEIRILLNQVNDKLVIKKKFRAIPNNEPAKNNENYHMPDEVKSFINDNIMVQTIDSIDYSICKICGEKRNRSDHLKDHFMRTHLAYRDYPYFCHECDYRSVSSSHMKTHLKNHKIEAEHKCKYCSYSKNELNILMNHQNTYHHNPKLGLDNTGQRRWTADEKTPKEKEKIRLNIEQVNNRIGEDYNYKCLICNKLGIKNLERHLKSHPNLIYECKYCNDGKKYNGVQLHAHCEEMHNDYNQDINFERCLICGLRHDKINDHYRNIHLIDDSKIKELKSKRKQYANFDAYYKDNHVYYQFINNKINLDDLINEFVKLVDDKNFKDLSDKDEIIVIESDEEEMNFNDSETKKIDRIVYSIFDHQNINSNELVSDLKNGRFEKLIKFVDQCWYVGSGTRIRYPSHLDSHNKILREKITNYLNEDKHVGFQSIITCNKSQALFLEHCATLAIGFYESSLCNKVLESLDMNYDIDACKKIGLMLLILLNCILEQDVYGYSKSMIGKRSKKFVKPEAAKIFSRTLHLNEINKDVIQSLINKNTKKEF